jgi:stalled ribosome alternative rescue factor ArfA
LCGGRDLVGKDGYSTDKKIKNEELSALIASDLWKVEEKKKEKK